MDGIKQIIADVQAEYHGRHNDFITGFEAGAHTVWQFVFQHPELLEGAAIVAGNYNSYSCMSDAEFSKDRSRVTLPVVGLAGSKDDWFERNKNQWESAKRAATGIATKKYSKS